MAHSHTVIGTTARAEPVEGTNLLFQNGYDRNENRPTRPLVKVLDIADTDDKYCEEDYRYEDDDNTTENVTVTIKLCADGIVTRTEAGKKNVEEKTHRKTPQPDKVLPPQSRHESEVAESATSNAVCASGNSGNRIPSEIVDLTETHRPPDTIVVENREQIQSRKDNLYNEYELFVERPPPNVISETSVNNENSRQDGSKSSKALAWAEDVIDLTHDSTSPSSENNMDCQRLVKPKVKVVKPVVLKSFQNESVSPSSSRSTPDRSPLSRESNRTPITDRSKLFSPKTKTPIVIELSPDDNDEGQDFMTYLQELRQTPLKETEDAEQAQGESTSGNHTRELHTQDNKSKRNRKLDRRNSDFSYKQQKAVHKRERRASLDVIVISDDEENSTDTGNNTLLDFNFGSLKNKKSCQGGYNVIVDTDNIQSSEEENGSVYHDASDKVLIDTDKDDAEDTSDEENEEDDELDDTKKTKSDDEDEDKDDGNEKGNGNSESREDFDDNFDDPDDDFDNDSYHSDESEEPNDQYENEGYFSPGMRSRASIGAETVSDFDNAEVEETCEKTTLEDEEVSEILDIFHRQSSIDCQFETIESRGMDVDTDSDATDNSGTVKMELENLQEKASTNTCDIRSFRKVTPKRYIELSDVTLDDNRINETLEAHLANVVKVSSDDEDFISFSSMHYDNESILQLSDCSLEIDNESDFESAIEDEFWANTVFSDSDQTSIVTECDRDDDGVNDDDLQDTCDLVKDINTRQHLSDKEYQSANGVDSDEQEMMETKYCNETPEKLLGAMNVQKVSKADDDFTYNSEKRFKTIETGVSCEERIRKIRSVRNVSYNVPFYKEEVKQELNPFLQKKIKLICKLRQNILAKIFPSAQDDSECSVSQNFKTQYIEDDIDWRKVKSKNDDTSKSDVKESEQIKDIGGGFYIFGVGDRLRLPCGPKLRKLPDDFDTDTKRRSIYFRGEFNGMHVVISDIRFSSVYTHRQ